MCKLNMRNLASQKFHYLKFHLIIVTYHINIRVFNFVFFFNENKISKEIINDSNWHSCQNCITLERIRIFKDFMKKETLF